MAYKGIKFDSLNDDCIINIFDYLSFEEKFKLVTVSKRWQSVMELSWRNVRQLKINDEKFENSNFIIKVIKKCGKYAKNLDICFNRCGQNISQAKYTEVFEEILKNCRNINQFSLSNYNSKVSELNLGLFFKKNQKIHSIKLYDLKTSGDCLSSLNSDIITDVLMHSCAFKSENYLNFFSNLKNLKKFFLLTYSNPYDVINALNRGCQNLCDITLSCGDDVDEKSIHELLILLSKQKNLYKLDLTFEDDKVFLDCIDERKFGSMDFYKNLTFLEFRVNELTNDCMKNLSNKCINLTTLNISIDEKYSLTAIGENYFSSFKNLQTFTFCNMSYTYPNINKVLKILCQCKELTKLDLSEFKVTIDTVGYIASFSNLTYLGLFDCKITELELFVLIVNLRNLTTLKIADCKKLNSHNIFKNINLLKSSRKDKHVLELKVDFSLFSHIEETNSNELPLIKIIKESRFNF